MKITSLEVSNFFSYDDETIKFRDYNVIVGPNAVGKTNISRLLGFLSSYRQDPNTNENSLQDLTLNKSSKMNRDKPSSVVIHLTLSNEELEIILSILMLNEVGSINIDELRKVVLIIHWLPSPDYEQKPSLILLHFNNGFTILNRQGAEFFVFSHELSKILERPHSNCVVERIDPLLSKFEPIRDDDSWKERHKSLPENSRSPNNLVHYNEFKHPFLNGKAWDSFEYLFEKNIFQNTQPRIMYEGNWKAKIFDYCGITRNRLKRSMSIWMALCSIIHNNIVLMQEQRPPISELAHDLHVIRNTRETSEQFELINNYFQQLFPGVTFKIFLDSGAEARRYFVEIGEKSGNEYRLEDSASGYFDALYIFKIISRKEEGLLVLDEPGLHLHPTKIRFFGGLMMQNTKREIIIITHSPYFVDTRLFSSGGNLIYINRKDLNSKIHYTSEKFELNIIRSLFEPEVFFSKFIILVEGAADVAIFIALSEKLNYVLERNDILVIGPDGSGNVSNYRSLFKEY